MLEDKKATPGYVILTGQDEMNVSNLILLMKQYGVSTMIDARSNNDKFDSSAFPHWMVLRDAMGQNLLHYQDFSKGLGRKDVDRKYLLANGSLNIREFAKGPLFSATIMRLKDIILQGMSVLVLGDTAVPEHSLNGLLYGPELNRRNLEVWYFANEHFEDHPTFEKRIVAERYQDYVQTAMFEDAPKPEPEDKLEIVMKDLIKDWQRKSG